MDAALPSTLPSWCQDHARSSVIGGRGRARDGTHWVGFRRGFWGTGGFPLGVCRRWACGRGGLSLRFRGLGPALASTSPNAAVVCRLGAARSDRCVIWFRVVGVDGVPGARDRTGRGQLRTDVCHVVSLVPQQCPDRSTSQDAGRRRCHLHPRCVARVPTRPGETRRMASCTTTCLAHRYEVVQGERDSVPGWLGRSAGICPDRE